MKWTHKGHEFDAAGRLLRGKRNAYLYGAGVLGLELYDLLQSLNRRLGWNVVFVDGDKSKQNDGMRGVPCLSPEELAGEDRRDGFVVVCAFEKNRREIAGRVEDMGWRPMENAFEHDYFLYRQLSLHFMYNLDQVYLSSLNIVPSTVCNLNCRGCLNFNPHIRRHTTYPLEELKADCDALFGVIDLIGRFQITGGEPLLYDRLGELIRHLGGKWLDKMVRLELVTNGTIVPTDAMCGDLRENRVHVFLDDYRKTSEKAAANYPLIVEKFRRHNVQFAENAVPAWFDLAPNLSRAAAVPENRLIEHYENCGCPWATLADKSISACNYALYSAKAGLMPRDARDYFDLTKVDASNKMELIEFRLRCNERGYVELCKRCDGFNGNTNFIEPAVQIPRRPDAGRQGGGV